MLSQRALKELNDRIERRNKRFAKLSKPEQRVRIAQDVLEQLRIGRFQAEQGTYVDAPEADEEIMRLQDSTEDHDLQEAVKKIRECNVCAVGACFVAAVAINDDLKLFGSSDINAFDYHGYIRRFFTAKQVQDMEGVFENWVPPQEWEDPNTYPYDGWGRTAQKRLTYIMRNIVRNKGQFKRGQRPEKAS